MRLDLRPLALGTLLALACAPPNPGAAYPTAEPPLGDPRATGAGDVLGRVVDVDGLLRAFPFERWSASVASDRLFFVEAQDRVTLKALDLSDDAVIDPAAAPALAELTGPHRELDAVLHARGRSDAWLRFGAQSGRGGLARLDLTAGVITDHAADHRIHAADLSLDGARLVYLASTPAGRACVFLLEASARASARELLCDSPELTFDGASILLAADRPDLYFVGHSDGDQGRAQILALDLSAKRLEAKPITDPKTRRRAPVLVGLLDRDTLLFIADDEGQQNLFTYARRGRELRQITRLREDISSAALLDAGVFVTFGSAAVGTTLALVDPRSGRILGQQRDPGRARLLGGHGRRAVWTVEAVQRPFAAHLATFTAAADGGAPTLADRRLLGPDERAQGHLVHCADEVVKIPTFDQDPATGRTRELHARLLRPRAPVEDDDRRLAVIRAWDGGEPRYERLDHLLCAAGVIVLSPTLRGASSLGPGLRALGGRDLGGDEILDLFAVARWAAATLALTPRQLGLYGEGRGAYAVLRAMTYETDTPAAAQQGFGFGFGIALSGRYDLEGADPRPEWAHAPPLAARLQERSPLAHLDRLAAPVLLVWGDRDPFAPTNGAAELTAAARARGLPVTELVLRGEGPAPASVAARLTFMQALLTFLEDRARAR
jgi:dipeptidyl aminopeptidase/acylaminoacyl peptidase